MIPRMKSKGWMLLLVPAVLLMAGILWRGGPFGVSKSTSFGSEILRVPRPEELGRVMPAESVLPSGHRQEPPIVSGSSHRSSAMSSSGGSMIPPAREVRKLQEEGGIIY